MRNSVVLICIYFLCPEEALTTMAESVRGNLSESSDDSSASYVLSSDSVASSDSTEEGDSKRKESENGGEIPSDSNKKAKDSTLNDEEMEVLVSWIFSSEESSKVETEIRATLKDDPQIKLEPERIKVVEHILDVAQKQLFELLIADFVAHFQL